VREADSFQGMSCLIDVVVMAKSVCTCLFLSRKRLYGLISANKKVIVCKYSKKPKHVGNKGEAFYLYTHYVFHTTFS
jgi:hypothetical protein